MRAKFSQCGWVMHPLLALLLSAHWTTSARAQLATSANLLPEPVGPSAIGRITYHWIDSARTEILASDGSARRELMVDVWYPAGPTAGPVAPYLPGLQMLRQTLPDSILRQRFAPAYAAIAAGRLATHAFDRAPAQCSAQGCPLLIFSHGGGVDRSLYTAQYEDFASHGYVVAAVAHTYLTHTVVFPDGRVLRLEDRRPPPRSPVDSTMVYWRQRFAETAATNSMRYAHAAGDVRFVINQMTRYAQDSVLDAPFVGQLDLNRIGALGHSMGGMAVAAACLVDSRIKACMNQDGTSDALPSVRDARGRTLSQPFTYFGRVERPLSPRADSVLARIQMTRAEDDSIRRARPREQDSLLSDVRGGAWRLRLRPDAQHMSFSDEPLIEAAGNEAMRANAMHMLGVIHRYARAFFDKTLRSRKDTILDQALPEDTVFLSIERFAPRTAR